MDIAGKFWDIKQDSANTSVSVAERTFQSLVLWKLCGLVPLLLGSNGCFVGFTPPHHIIGGRVYSVLGNALAIFKQG